MAPTKNLETTVRREKIFKVGRAKRCWGALRGSRGVTARRKRSTPGGAKTEGKSISPSKVELWGGGKGWCEKNIEKGQT